MGPPLGKAHAPVDWQMTEQSGPGGAWADRQVAAATSAEQHAWGPACEAEVALHWALGIAPTPATVYS